MSLPVTIPPRVGSDPAALERWLRDAATRVNNALQEIQSAGGAVFIWGRNCVAVPTNTTEANAFQVVFDSTFAGNAILFITLVGASGGVQASLNGVSVGTFSDPDVLNEVRFERPVANLVNGLNVLRVWSNTSDAGELRMVEIWRAKDGADVTSQNIALGFVAQGALATLSSIDLALVTDAGALAALNAQDVVFIGATAPNPAINPLWQDTVPSPDQLKRWNGTAWQTIATLVIDLEALPDGATRFAAAEAGADVTGNASPTMIANPGFEQGDVGWPSKTGTFVISQNANARTGAWVAQAGSGTLSSMANSVEFPVGPGERIEISGWVKSSGATDGTARLRLIARDSAGVNITALDTDILNPTSNIYTRLRKVVTMPAGTAKALVQLIVSNVTAGAWWFDDIDLARIAKDSDIDALLTTNGPSEAGATVNPKSNENVALNPIFTLGASNRDFWNNGTVVAEATTTPPSNNALELTNDLGAFQVIGVTAHRIPVEPGERWEIGGWFKRTLGNGEAWIRTQYEDKDFVFVSAAQAVLTPADPQNTWIFRTTRFTIPANVAFLNMNLRSRGTAAGFGQATTVRFKNVFMRKLGLAENTEAVGGMSAVVAEQRANQVFTAFDATTSLRDTVLQLEQGGGVARQITQAFAIASGINGDTFVFDPARSEIPIIRERGGGALGPNPAGAVAGIWPNGKRVRLIDATTSGGTLEAVFFANQSMPVAQSDSGAVVDGAALRIDKVPVAEAVGDYEAFFSANVGPAVEECFGEGPIICNTRNGRVTVALDSRATAGSAWIERGTLPLTNTGTTTAVKSGLIAKSIAGLGADAAWRIRIASTGSSGGSLNTFSRVDYQIPGAQGEVTETATPAGMPQINFDVLGGLEGTVT